jgi:hypothetical protein
VYLTLYGEDGSVMKICVIGLIACGLSLPVNAQESDEQRRLQIFRAIACYKEEARRLDDRVSDAMTIGRVIVAVCIAEVRALSGPRIGSPEDQVARIEAVERRETITAAMGVLQRRACRLLARDAAPLPQGCQTSE